MDERHIERLYEATSKPLLAYLITMTGRRDVAEDLLQETFLRYLNRRGDIEDLEEAKRFLFRIASNLMKDRWRRGETLQWAEPTEESVVMHLEDQIETRRMLQALKPRERELLWLAYVEGMTHAEIAAIMRTNAMSVKVLLFRARANAIKIIKPEKGGTV